MGVPQWTHVRPERRMKPSGSLAFLSSPPILRIWTTVSAPIIIDHPVMILGAPRRGGSRPTGRSGSVLPHGLEIRNCLIPVRESGDLLAVCAPSDAPSDAAPGGAAARSRQRRHRRPVSR